MTTIFNQNKEFYNQYNKILHPVSHLGLKAAPLIVKTEPSDFVPGSSDTHAQLLNFSAPLCFILSDHA